MAYRDLLVAVALLGAAASVSAQSVKSGIDAWQRADYRAAVAAWRPLAEQGDADAQFNLGQAYRLGRGVTTNLAAAKIWFERAARQGHVDAETTLGLLLFQNGTQAEGLGWLKKAAEQGEPRAQLVYGTALVNGDSITQNPARGYAFVSRAAAQGLQPAKQTLADLDKLIPIADRKKGSALARQLAKAPPAPPTKPQAKPKPVQVAAAPPAAKKPAMAAPKAAPTPTPIVAATGNWRIQLGAFAQKGSAETLFRNVAAKPAVAGRRPFYIAAGPVTRLQVGPFESKAAATAACRAVGVPCFAVPAK